MRWRLMLSLFFGFATMGSIFMATQYRDPGLIFLFFLVALNAMLACMSFAQDDGRQVHIQRNASEAPKEGR